ncbi:MAG: tryptophan--tRNA ligase, partial [Kordiimonadaceae bacterium]|nr:tryptophan--tRNA ligase [Kordiimonadaceae bacterium]
MSKRVFSGAQPSGNMHLGNYLGALRNWARLQNDDTECLYCIVDMHAITVWQDPKALQNQVREAAAAYIASGVDPKRSILF